MNLQENIHRIKQMMGIDNTRLIFNIQKLVDDNIIFVTKPGDGQGGIAEPNWEGDCSVITLDNLTKKEIKLNPWRLEAIKHPLPNCISFVQDNQSEWSDEKYHQVISSIKRAKGDIKDYIINLQEQTNRIQSMMGVINEGLHDTSWENDEGNKITLIDLLNATEDIPVRKISVEELKPHLLSWDGDEDEVRKIESADLQYPILIFVNDDGGFITIIDGHHRTQKAVRRGLETIKAKVIPINSLPKDIRRVFKHIN